MSATLARDGSDSPSRMAAEIREIPALVERLLAEGNAEIRATAGFIRAAHPRWVSLVGRGTSDHAGVYARYLIEARLGLPVALAAPAIQTVYRRGPDWAGAVVVAISQSGEGPDVAEVVELARRGGAVTVAITNEPASRLAELAEHVLWIRAGEERAVAATKTYVTELAALAALVAAWGPDDELGGALASVPDALARALHAGTEWIAQGAATRLFAPAAGALVTARGFDLATALEVALKLKETCGMFAEGYSAADLLHGPVALARSGVPALAIRSSGPVGHSVDVAVERLRGAGSPVAMIHVRDDGAARWDRDDGLTLDLVLGLPEALAPLATVIPGQLLAEAVARARGRDPDAPIGLAKVTRTR